MSDFSFFHLPYSHWVIGRQGNGRKLVGLRKLPCHGTPPHCRVRSHGAKMCVPSFSPLRDGAANWGLVVPSVCIGATGACICGAGTRHSLPYMYELASYSHPMRAILAPYAWPAHLGCGSCVSWATTTWQWRLFFFPLLQPSLLKQAHDVGQHQVDLGAQVPN